MLVQTEVERVKFVVRSYIRTRLYKVRYIPFHCSAAFELLNGRSTDRKVRTVYCVHTRGTGEAVASRTGPCETVRA